MMEDLKPNLGVMVCHSAKNPTEIAGIQKMIFRNTYFYVVKSNKLPGEVQPSGLEKILSSC